MDEAKLRILILEDSPEEAERIARELLRAGLACEWRRAEDADDFRRELQVFSPDLILADDEMPGFDAPSALRILQESGRREIPLILITDTGPEEATDAAMREEADDDVLKSSLMRLPSAVRLTLKHWETKRALRESEERWQFALEGAGDGVWDWNPVTGSIYFSSRWKAMLGYQEGEIEANGAQWKRLIHPEDREETLARLEGCLQGRTPTYRSEYRLLCKDGSYKWTLSRGKVIRRDAGGKPLRMIGTQSDITLRKQAEDALRGSERQYRSLFENMLEGCAHCRMIFDDQGLPADFVYLNVNPAFERLTGLENVAGRAISEVLPEVRKYHPEVFESYGRVAMTGIPEKFEIDFKPLEQWLSISVYSPARGEFVAVFDNISSRKKAEDGIRRSEASLAEAQRIAHLGSWELNPITGQAFWSDELCRLFEISPETIRAGSSQRRVAIEERIHPDDLGRYREAVDRSLGQKMPYDIVYRIRLADGSQRHIHAQGMPTFDQAGNLVRLAGTAIDITERKQAEEALQESEEKYRLLVENVNEAIFVAQNGRLVFVNPITARIVGHTPEELLFRSFGEFVHPDDRALVIERHEKRLSGLDPCNRYSFRLISRSGEIKWVELNTVRIQWSGQPATLNLLTEIGARKRLEQEMARKITDQLTAGIAHQIRNPLFVISLSVQLMEKKLPAKDPQRRLTRAILDKVHKLDEVTADLVHLGKYRQLQLIKESLRKRLEAALALVRASANAQQVKIVRRYYPHLPRAWIDGKAMDEVFVNLLANALEAMPEGGLLTVETDLDEERKELMVRVQDSGCGIPEDARDHIFIPFSTTKESGSGLGLVFCKRVVEEHGGRLTFQSDTEREGHGTTFQIALPLARPVLGKRSDD